MKRLTFYLFVFLLTLMMYASLALAQPAIPAANQLFGWFSDPVAFAGIVANVAGIFTGWLTDYFKTRNIQMRGWHTRLVAAAIAAILAGGAGYFGLSYFADTGGLTGALTAAGMAAYAWFFSEVNHKTRVFRKTGQRDAVRENEIVPGLPVEEVQEVVDPILTNLLKEAAKLPPPFGIAASIVTTVYEMFGAAAVLKLIRQQRALSEAEKNEDQNAWEEGQKKTPQVHPVAP